MKKRITTRLLCLALLALLAVGMLCFTGCSNNNPYNKDNLVEEVVSEAGQTAPAETTESGEPVEAEAKTVQVNNTEELSDEVKLSFFDYVKLPFSYLLRWLYDLTQNYGVALILFALIVKFILLPASAKSKKGMMAMSRLTPKVKALEAAYGDDKATYQQEVNKLYKEEGAGGCGGCLWSLLPLLILIPLYEIIREPISWLMFHGNVSQRTLGELQNVLIRGQLKGFDVTGVYWQMQAIPHFTGELLSAARKVSEAVVSMNTKLLGVELATVPKLMFWKNFDSGVWNAVGQFLLPLVSGGMNMLSMWIGQKMNNTVIVDEKGQQDAEMAKQNQTNKVMTYMMPLMSVYIGFVAPAGLSIYWIVQGLFSLVQDYFLTKHYKKFYDAEDAVKQAAAAKLAAEEAERERLRAEKWAENPEGFVGSASKKKLQQRQKNEQAAKEAAYLEKQAALNPPKPQQEAVPKEDSSRPFRRGRNYDPNRYGQRPDAEGGTEGSSEE